MRSGTSERCGMNGKIAERLTRISSVFLDSMAFIYFIEEDERYLPTVQPLFEMVERGKLAALSSYVSLLEVLIQPLKQQRLDIVRQYKEILCDPRIITLLPIDAEVAEKAARIRAQYAFRVPDAIQLACAVCHGAGAFVTNDLELTSFTEIDIVFLDELSR